jgi:ABC-type sugar transport system substrate-binding protein
MPNARGPVRLAAVAAIAALLMLTGCANSGGGSTATSASSAPAAPSSAPAQLQGVPDALKTLYQNFNIVPVTGNPIEGYKAPKAPWKFCLSETYTGEAFRTGPPLGADGMLTKLVGQLQQAGQASGPLQISNSNLNTSVQITQVNNFVQEGCNVIFTLPGSLTGLCSATQNAWSHGVLVIALSSELNCPHVVTVDNNEYTMGYLAAQNLAKRLGNKGRVLLVNGIKGVAAPDAERLGALAAFKAIPGIKIVGEVYGNYTGSVAKSTTLQFVSTHPGQLDGVWQAGLMAAAVHQALQQSGHNSTTVEALSATSSELALWKLQGGDNFSFLQAGEPYAYEAVQAAVRILMGATPKVNVLLFDIPQVDGSNFAQWYNASMTLNSNGFPNAPAGFQVKANALDPLFNQVPANLPALTYFTG